ncbi:helix-turn-helix domain-containing protein [Petrimonas sulfuriphila]|uniref:helix-turn-helix domain-containing protein n=1 Tax=Petrimonas sulfuriphila TaxID=285070 RepID=UPI003EB74A91
MESQTIQIKEHLLSGKSITPIEALNRYGCFRLGARIFDLKRDGLNIKTEMVERGGKRFAEYRLIN